MTRSVRPGGLAAAGSGIQFIVTGEGSPTLVFVHGYGCALEDWDGQITRLARTHRCLALDLPGHGRSKVPTGPPMLALAEAVNDIRRRVVRGSTILIGHSLGVRVVIDAYLAEPDAVSGLVLIDGRYYDGSADEIEQRMKAMVDEHGFDAFLDRNFTGMFTETADPELRARIVCRAHALDENFGRELFLQAILSDPLCGQKTHRRIAVPTLLLQSTDIDERRRLVSLAEGMRTRYMDVIEDWVPGATAKVVPGVGHFTMIEAPELVSDEIERFSDRVCAGTRRQQVS